VKQFLAKMDSFRQKLTVLARAGNLKSQQTSHFQCACTKWAHKQVTQDTTKGKAINTTPDEILQKGHESGGAIQQSAAAKGEKGDMFAYINGRKEEA
jgi:hypothetical protein